MAMIIKNSSVIMPVILYRILIATAVVGAGLPSLLFEAAELPCPVEVEFVPILAMTVGYRFIPEYICRESETEVIE